MPPKTGDFRPGHSVHPIQARKAWEDPGSWQPVTLLYASAGKIAVRATDGGTHWYKCGEFIRFLEATHLEPGLVSEPRQLILAGRWSILIVPAGTVQAPTNAVAEPADPAFKLRGGSVTGAIGAQPGSGRPMFSIASTDPIEGVDLPSADAKSHKGVGSRRGRQRSAGPQRASLWVVDGRFVCEPFVGGMQLGELPDYDVAGYELVHLTQAEFDAMMQDLERLHGHYPDT